MRHSDWFLVAPLALVGMPSAYCAQYLSVEQAQQQMFPAGSVFESVKLSLNDDQQRRVAAAGSVMSNFEPRAWLVRAGSDSIGYFFVHEVIGKQELITYAVAIDAAGKVTAVEILAYRESHGQEIRNPRWRAQFAGKTARDTVKLDADISNISGATLSCRHVTDGVRHILAIHDAAMSAKP